MAEEIKVVNRKQKSVEEQTLQVLKSLEGLLKMSGVALNNVTNESSPVNTPINSKSSGSQQSYAPQKRGVGERFLESEKTQELRTSLFKTLLGPLRLITDPIQDFTKTNFQEKFEKGLVKGYNFLFGKDKTKQKLNPNKSDLSKTESGQAILYGLSEQERLSKKGEGGLFSKLFGTLTSGIASLLMGGGMTLLPNVARAGTLQWRNLMTGKFMSKSVVQKLVQDKVGSMLIKGFGIASIVAGVVMMVIDGFKGFFKANAWKTSKISAFIGGFLGGTGSGLKGAFANMGKWALVGAGIGTLIFPGVGTLVGGLIGAAVGGILGWIGGKNLAKAFDNLGKWATDTIEKGKKGFQDLMKKNPLFRIIFKGAKAWFDFISAPFMKLIEAFTEIFSDVSKIWTDKKSNIFQKLGKTFLVWVQAPFKVFGKVVIEGFFGRFGKLFDAVFRDIIPDFKKNIGPQLLKFLGDVLGKIASTFSSENMRKLGDVLNSVFQNLTFGIRSFFDQIGFFFMDAVEMIKTKGIGSISSVFTGDEKFKKFQQEQSSKRKDQKRKELDAEYKSKLGQLNPKSADYAKQKADLELWKASELKYIEGLRTGGLALTPGYVKIAEHEPELVIPKSRIVRGFDNPEMNDIFRSLDKKTSSQNYGKEIADAIYKLIEVTKQTSSPSIVQNFGSSMDMNLVRKNLAYNS